MTLTLCSSLCIFLTTSWQDENISVGRLHRAKLASIILMSMMLPRYTISLFDSQTYMRVRINEVSSIIFVDDLRCRHRCTICAFSFPARARRCENRPSTKCDIDTTLVIISVLCFSGASVGRFSPISKNFVPIEELFKELKIPKYFRREIQIKKFLSRDYKILVIEIR